MDVQAGIDPRPGTVYATFQSIDPNTDLPPDVLTGFLPPEDGTGRGEGYISYTIQPKAGLPTGTQITNVALVSFDWQQPSPPTRSTTTTRARASIRPSRPGHDRRGAADQQRQPLPATTVLELHRELVGPGRSRRLGNRRLRHLCLR